MIVQCNCLGKGNSATDCYWCYDRHFDWLQLSDNQSKSKLGNSLRV